jgi:hypothetical protein
MGHFLPKTVKKRKTRITPVIAKRMYEMPLAL